MVTWTNQKIHDIIFTGLEEGLTCYLLLGRLGDSDKKVLCLMEDRKNPEVIKKVLDIFPDVKKREKDESTTIKAMQ